MIRVNDILDAVSEYNPDADLDIIKKAYIYAYNRHAGIERKDGEPYITHPLEVAGILTKLKMDVASIAAAFLHDVIEDTETAKDEIIKLFGQEIADLVDGVTKISAIQFSSKEVQASENFRKMLIAMSNDIRVILIKLADRLHNMRTLDSMAPEKRIKIAQETMDIYAPIANRLGISWIKTELEDLSFKYLYPKEYQMLMDSLSSRQAERHKYIEEVKNILKEKISAQNITCEVHGRVKHLYSIYRKMKMQNVDLNQIYDILAFRVLVNTVQECYEVLGVIHANWKPIPGRFKDFIALPKVNGYKSLHTTVLGPKGERIEIQIRTYEMHRIAEFGIAAHWRYKEGKLVQDKEIGKFDWLRQLMEIQKDEKDPDNFLEQVKQAMFQDEVFVFTPNGDVKELPAGSTPVDFAYSIHTDIGHRCAGAKVNNQIVPLRYQLRNGDVVEIITSNEPKVSRDWLTFVKSSRAISKINAFLRQEQKERFKQIGRQVLEKELRKHNMSIGKFLKSQDMEKVLKENKLSDENELYYVIGSGKYTAAELLKVVIKDVSQIEEEKDQQIEEEKGISKIIKKVIGGSSTAIVIDGINDVVAHLAKCCNPIPGDKIVGYITRKKGIVVHLKGCPKASLFDKSRQVDVTWGNKDSHTYTVGLRILTDDRPGILASISRSLSELEINIAEANCKTFDNGKAICLFKIGVKNKSQLDTAIKELSTISGVNSVERNNRQEDI
ncbi:MAG: bifunctional (p)ppGpp synthetase/guanosine-3',5'-bis(diphosphate) 3'-pyrophosphohydrolase [Deltaproteobacteria bacterium]|nr:bifunctional (p)ppGpp synthetase/guanosine-3',5'-bis(diphosphate) 3'-pyrophosphohydrolase [Deltaproteobacteria bacterium]